jgi:monoamine oxidase
MMAKKERKIARREFLENIGKAAGSTAMVRAMMAMGIGVGVSSCGSSSAESPNQMNLNTQPMSIGTYNSPKSARPGDWPANSGAGKSVVILGAGIAGMTSAFELQKLGYSVSILEATNRAGGRIRTIRSGDVVNELTSSQTCNFDVNGELYFNPGPARIAHHHEFLIGYCREFNVSLENFTNDNRAALLHSPSAFGGTPQVAKTVFSDIRGNISSLLASAINQNALDQALTSNDKANVLSMLRNYGDLDSNYSYSGSSRAGFSGQENVGSRDRDTQITVKNLSDLVSDTFLQSRWINFSEGYNQQSSMLQPIGGMDKIATAFRGRVASNITYGAVVKEIRKVSNSTRIIYEKNGIQIEHNADYCICTIPTTVLKDIPNDFSEAHKTEISSFVYSNAAKLAFQSRRFWEQDHSIFGGISWTNQDITQIWYPSNALGHNDGIIIGAYIWGNTASTNFSNQSPQQRINSALLQGNNLHSEYQSEVSKGISVAWRNIPFQLGAYGLSTANTLLTPDDNIIFAGEHLSILKGWQEGAILSAYNAINEITKKVHA